MSLFKNQNNDFEKKLRDQLNETEFKPSDSLWSRIDQEVNRPEFEKKVEGKIGNYQLDPKKETWEQIEAQLPPEPNGKNRKKYLWIPLTVLLFVGGLGIGFWLNQIENASNMLVINGNEQQAPSAFEELPNVETKKSSSIQTNTQNEILNDNPVDEEFENIKPKQNDVYANDNNQPKYLTSQTKKSTKKQIDPTTSTQTVYNSKLPTASGNEINSGLNKNAVAQKYSQAQIQIALTTSNQTPNNNQPPIVSDSGVTNILPKNDVTDNQSQNKKQITTTQILSDQEGTAEREQTTQKQTFSNTTQAEVNEPLANESTLQQADTAKSIKTVLSPLNDSSISVAKTSPNQTDEERPSKLSLSIMMGAHYSQMHLYTNQPQLAKHVSLRNQIESAEIEWSGAFLLDYKLKKFLISSGVQFTNFSMSIRYGTTPAVQQPSQEPNSQILTKDSITADGLNNTRIRYTWNEIPLLITYRFTPHKRLGIEAKFGVSYAFISTIDAALVGQNNVGVFAVKNKESFPNIRNSIFGQAFLGLAYQVNSSITFTAMPYLRYSLNNMIDGNYAVKQHPYMVGMSLGLRKHF